MKPHFSITYLFIKYIYSDFKNFLNYYFIVSVYLDDFKMASNCFIYKRPNHS